MRAIRIGELMLNLNREKCWCGKFPGGCSGNVAIVTSEEHDGVYAMFPGEEEYGCCFYPNAFFSEEKNPAEEIVRIMNFMSLTGRSE